MHGRNVAFLHRKALHVKTTVVRAIFAAKAISLECFSWSDFYYLLLWREELSFGIEDSRQSAIAMNAQTAWADAIQLKVTGTDERIKSCALPATDIALDPPPGNTEILRRE